MTINSFRHLTPVQQPAFAGAKKQRMTKRVAIAALAALPVLGAATACSSGTVQQGGPQTCKPPMVEVGTTKHPIDIYLSDNFTGRFIYGEQYGLGDVELGVHPGWTTDTIEGYYKGNPVNLEDHSGWTDETLKGQFECQPVDLKITSGLASKHITGTFKGKSVDFKIIDKFFGNRIEGTFDGKPIALDVGLDFNGRTIEGTFEGQPVQWQVQHGWSKDHVTGEMTLSDDAQADLLATLLIEAASNSDD